MSGGHALFVAALGVSWLAASVHVLLSDRPVYAWSRASLGLPVRVHRLLVLLLGALIYGTLLWAWATSAWPRLAAVGVLVALLALRQWEKRQWSEERVVRLGKYVPSAACLLAWLVASTVYELAGASPARADAAGWQAAAGILAAIYTLAALSKIQLTGAGWVASRHQALLVAERAFSGPRPLRRLRRWVAARPRICGAMGTVGLGAELACVLYVVPAARVPLTVAVLALHAGIVLLLGYVEPEWWLVMIAVTAITGSLS